jgi:hypothetical protein
VWAATGRDHDVPFRPGCPVWCESTYDRALDGRCLTTTQTHYGCRDRIADAMVDIGHWIGDMPTSGALMMAAPPERRGTGSPPSPSPAFDEREAFDRWLDDVAGNPDDTWKYLEWRDTHGVIREYIVLNVRKRFAQYRLTEGELIPNRAMANEAMIRGYLLELCMDLANRSLVVKGQAARQYIQDNMSVVLTLAERKAQVALTVPMVSQLGQIIGTIKFSFDATG